MDKHDVLPLARVDTAIREGYRQANAERRVLPAAIGIRRVQADEFARVRSTRDYHRFVAKLVGQRLSQRIAYHVGDPVRLVVVNADLDY